MSSPAVAKRSVPVQVLGQEYRIRTDADEESVARVAALVNGTLDRIRTRTGTVDSFDLAVLTALNLANDLLARREAAAAGGEPVDAERLRALTDAVEAVLRESAGSS